MVSAIASILMAMLAPALSQPSRGPEMSRQLTAKIDAAILRCLRETGAPSASVAIVFGNQIAYLHATGKSNLATGQRVSASTRYQLASISKTFTAQAVLILASEGKLTLGDPISRWFPNLTEATHVTVRQLLSHTGGFPDHYPQSYPAGPRSTSSPPDRIIDEWGRHPLLFLPGSRFQYSNLDYEIAGRIVEKVSGEPLFAFMQHRIFRPIGMSEVMDLDSLPIGSPELATGYVRYGLSALQPAPFEGPGWSFGSGQVVTTAQDVAKWDIAFLERRVLPEPEATQEMTPVPLDNGGVSPAALGLFVSHLGDQTRIYHTGQGLGFVAMNMIYPDQKLAIVVLSNTNAGDISIRILNQIATLILPPSKKDLAARRIFEELQNGRLDPSDLTDDLRKFLSKGLLKAYRDGLRPLGAIESFTFQRSQSTDGFESRDYEVIAGGHPLNFHLLMDSTGRAEDATVTDARRIN